MVISHDSNNGLAIKNNADLGSLADLRVLKHSGFLRDSELKDSFFLSGLLFK